MTVELSREARQEAIRSIERWFQEHEDEFAYWRKFEKEKQRRGK